jgi:hypothetical protein
MATPKQLEANRTNAKLGGVKTPEGKAVSKLNATKHGLLSKEVLLSGENEKSLVGLGKRLRAYIQPVGELEVILTDRVITNTWRLKRTLGVEKATMEWQREYELRDTFGSDPKSEQTQRKATRDMISNNDIEKLIRYETAIERSLYKALHELQRIQLARSTRKPIAPLAIDLD